MHAYRGGLRFVCSLRYFRGSRRMEEPDRRGDSRDCVPRASDFYIWPGPIPFRVWPNRIPRAPQKEVQDRSTVWLEFARWSRFRRVTYFRASSGYTYVNAPVAPPPSVLLSLPPTTIESKYRIFGRGGFTPSAIRAHIRVLLRGLHPRLNPWRLRDSLTNGSSAWISARSREKINDLFRFAATCSAAMIQLKFMAIKYVV